MTTRVKVNMAPLRRYIETNPEMRAAQLDVGEEIKTRAAANTPRGRHRSPGRQAMHQTFVVRPYRHYVRVGSTSSFFHLLEYGSVNNPAYAPIRRAALSLGTRGIHFKERAK